MSRSNKNDDILRLQQKLRIEEALERVREAALKMQATGDLSATSAILFQELKKLGIESLRSGVCIIDWEANSSEVWLTTESKGNAEIKVVGKADGAQHPMYNEWYQTGRDGKPYFYRVLQGQKLRHYYHITANHLRLPELDQLNPQEHFYGFFFQQGSLNVVSETSLTSDQCDTMLRFARAFGLIYTRFLDLQKAEKQAREAQIETALERIRAKGMAMHHTSELQDVILIVAKQLQNLDIDINGGAFICINKDLDDQMCFWGANGAGDYAEQACIPFFDRPIYTKMLNAIQTRSKGLLAEWYTHDEKHEFFYHLFQHYSTDVLSKKRQRELLNRKGGYARSIAISDHTSVMIIDHFGRRFSDEENAILVRVGAVFEQTYLRFLDLKKAETQAREAQIEVALERVRSKSMAMHESKDLHTVSLVVFEQLEELGVFMHAALIHENLDDKIMQHFWVAANGQIYSEITDIPITRNAFFTRFVEAQKSGEKFFTQSLSKAQKNNFFKHYFTKSSHTNVPEERRDFIYNGRGLNRSTAIHENTAISIMRYDRMAYSPEENDLIRRFALVFQQAYRRFLDLKKAEAQAREAQIETALERVRARTMAMHQSGELAEVARVIYEQLGSLGITNDLNRLSIELYDWNHREITHWITELGGEELMQSFKIPMDGAEPWTSEGIDEPFTAVFDQLAQTEPEKRKDLTEVLDYEGRQYDALLRFSVDQGIVNDEVLREIEKGNIPRKWISHYTFFSHGSLILGSIQKINSEDFLTLQRFAVVFEQSYTRFLDLQKAETQAREAQIEAALERIRSRTMAMHQSQDLHTVVTLLFDQLASLGLVMNSALIHVDLEDSKMQHFWGAANGQVYPDLIHIPITRNAFFTRFIQAREQGEHFYTQILNKRQKDNWFKLVFTKSTLTQVTRERKDFIYAQKGLARSTALHENTALTIQRYDKIPYSSEENEIIRRFAQVFQQTYTRFLDLKKAEAQAREAQIEAALERVRARAMAMHRSEDLAETSTILFEEMTDLGIEARRVGFCTFEDEGEIMKIWSTVRDKNGKARLVVGKLRSTQHPLLSRMTNAWRKKESFHTAELHGQDLQNYYQTLESELAFPKGYKRSVMSAAVSEFYHNCYFETGCIYAFGPKAFNSDQLHLMERFTHAFDLTYRRFLDLKQAEERAREAEVEAALERVRAKAMAMHSSTDLTATISLLVAELEGLDIHPMRCGFGRVIFESRKAELYLAKQDQGGHKIELVATVSLTGHPVFEGIYDAWKSQEEYLPVLEGRSMTSYYKRLQKFMDVERPPKGTVQYGYFIWYDDVGLYAWSGEPYSEAMKSIYRKFAAVLGLTYNRYSDLKDAEARALKAKREASLDRVRAEIASMRTSDDLKKITPLIWRELITLEIPFFRCGLFIVGEEEKLIKVFLTTPDGKSLAAYDIPFSSSDFVDNMLQSWRGQEILSLQWNREQFVEFTNSIFQQGILEDVRDYQGAEDPPEKLALHFIPFSQGMLYVGSEDPLADEQLEVVRGLSNAFSVAYARYEDFEQLEKAKASLENTLAELKSAQSQLIQAEKMASLGELTAGIAHEIQNPLNFVNNFSELSTELLDELIEEIKMGKTEEFREITDNIQQNLQKIVHHGKRAEGIVRAMLQHSRTGARQKASIDINALCMEYMKLAYHGMRARDKSFQVDYQLKLEEGLPKVEVISDEIGRVLLNLLGNAFHEVHEKRLRMKGAQITESFQPQVVLSSKQQNGQIIISVRDNADGVPEGIRDKIFQPFFTTKPTGEGTGLGLSLSYDIVRSHGGELMLNTEVGQGSDFYFTLPLSRVS